MSSKGTLLEILAATAFAAMNAFACVWISVWGGRGLEELYGGVTGFPLTQAALAGKVGGPMVIAGAWIMFLLLRRRIDRIVACWAFVWVVSATTVLIGVGIVQPFSRTFFHMGSP